MAAVDEEQKKRTAFPTDIPAQSIYGRGAVRQPAAPAQPLDAQAASDREAIGRAWGAVKNTSQKAGAAVADIGTLPIRAAAGAYDTAVIRPMRAVGLNAAYVSPLVNPASNASGASGASMTPFYDQMRSRDASGAQASYSNEGRNSKPTETPAAQVAQAVVDSTPQTKAAMESSPQAAADQLAAGAQRIDRPSASPLFTNLPADDPSNVALQARGAPSTQNQAAATVLQNRGGFGAVNTMQGMPQAEIDRTLNNPNGTRWSERDNAIMAANIRDGIDPYRGTSSSQPTPGQQFVQQARGVMSPSTRGMTIQQAKRAQARFEQDQAKSLPGILESGARIDSESTKFGMDRQRAGLDAAKAQDDMATSQLRRDASQVEIDAARQAAGLQRQYLEAPDEATRAEVAKKIAALSGKSAGAAKDNFMVVGGGQEWDQASGLMRNVPQRLIDVRTGKEVGVSAGQQGGQQALPPGLVVGAPTKQPDGTYPVGNKTVTIKAGKVSEIK